MDIITFKHSNKQESIPVECLRPACRPYPIVLPTEGGVVLPGEGYTLSPTPSQKGHGTSDQEGTWD